jgi:hypothetical protein
MWGANIQNNPTPFTNDIIATIVGEGEVVWYKNLGAGTRWEKKLIFVNLNFYPFEVAVGDLNKDGNEDVVAAYLDYTSLDSSWVIVNINQGNGDSWTQRRLVPRFDGMPRQLRVADVNGDNHLDVVVAVNADSVSKYPDYGVYWWENNGNMGFTRHKIGNANAWKVWTYDEEGDGKLEIIVSEQFFGRAEGEPCRLVLYKNNGNNFTEKIIDENLGNTMNPVPRGGGVVAYNFDSDGEIEIISGSHDRGVIYFYKKRSSGDYRREKTIDSDAPEFDGIDICDFDLDGDMDFVACGRAGWISWYKNNGEGEFEEILIDDSYRFFDLPYITYLNGDSCCDIGVSVAPLTSSGDGRVIVYLHLCGATGVEERKIKGEENRLSIPSIIKEGMVEISYKVEERGNVEVEIFDITGKRVKLLVNDEYCIQPGVYNLKWNVTCGTGVYFVKLKNNEYKEIKKIIIIR